MIEHIRTDGFKGFELDEDVPMKVLYCGKNRSGKSTRAAAIALVIYGHIPFLTSGKRPVDIMDSYCSKDSLVVAAKINGTEFARKFSRTETGATQTLQVNKRKKSAQDFAVELQKAGAPKIADVAEFMKQSEQKKIDTLFDLFPVDGDLNELDSKIESAKADVSRFEQKKKSAVAVVQRLTESKNCTVLPSGTLAEVKKEIESIDIQVKDLNEQVKQAELEEAKSEGKEEGKKEGEEKILADQKKEIMPDKHGGHAFIDGGYPEVENRFGSVVSDEKTYKVPLTKAIDDCKKIEQNAIDSIQRIINALTGAGCETCAALIIAKQELKKYV